MAAPHSFHPTSLREYDVRGTYGITLSEDDARALGRSFGTLVCRGGGRHVAVGRDGRLSSPSLSAALIEGLNAAGCDVTDIGLGPTPMLYFATYHLPADAGIMVTGSHNPPDMNGFKMMLSGKPFFGDDIQSLGRLAEAADWESGSGSATTADIVEAYVTKVAEAYRSDRQFSVVWDCGNGAAGAVIDEIVRRLPGRHVVLYGEVDGTFPNHHPDPTVPANLRQLASTVRGTGAHLGIAFDGDGDRIGVVDGEGEMLFGDQIVLLLARAVLAERPGATIIADVKASQVLFDGIAEAGGTPLMFRTGHSLIKAKMAEIGSPLAGEMSGHIFFADRYYGFDDAPYAGVRLLDMLAGTDQTVAEMRKAMPQFVNTPELRFDCDDTRKFDVVTEIVGRLRADGVEFSDVDGARVMTDDGWWLIRASNTQPVLVARCEARTDDGLRRLKDLLVDQLQKSGIDAPEGL
ncbi:MAG: phosphoglucomutase/phosphomannomutase PgmG [Minwuia sp.]|uniref:phosphoglucomutase/phosphomannomutase PgmG n=1 Tax=Minwuia sp. TaxID=2493630 RepID=UPI003A85BA1B